MYKFLSPGNNITEVIRGKDKFNQLFQDKLFLVMLVLGLLTIVAAAGAITIQRGNTPGENPYMQMEEPGKLMAEETQEEKEPMIEIVEQTVGASEEAGGTEGSQTVQNSRKDAQTKGSEDPYVAAGTGKDAATPLVLDFSDASTLGWPVRGNILLDYSMDTTTYFPTLDQYQCNPAVVIQASISDPVETPAPARVVSVSSDEELGNYVVLDLGNDYVATCGQLKDIQVMENEYLEAGQVLGYVAEPTKYYSVEGSNVYFKLMHDGKAVDPVGYFQ